MPTKLKREDDIDSAYDYNPTARSLSDSEKATSGSYADAGIDQAEAFANDPANASGDVRDRETNATDDNGGWTVNRTPGGGAIKQGNRAIKILKKGGPAGAILGILLSLAGLVSFFGGPGLLIVNLAEVMTQKFNYQLASMDVRSDRIMAAKFKNSTTGVCSSVVSIRCKYSTFSKRELDNFKKAGFKVETDGKSISGRYKITSLELESGKPIAAKDFANELKNNPNFKTAMKRAYNPKFELWASTKPSLLMTMPPIKNVLQLLRTRQKMEAPQPTELIVMKNVPTKKKQKIEPLSKQMTLATALPMA